MWNTVHDEVMYEMPEEADVAQRLTEMMGRFNITEQLLSYVNEAERFAGWEIPMTAEAEREDSWDSPAPDLHSFVDEYVGTTLPWRQLMNRNSQAFDEMQLQGRFLRNLCGEIPLGTPQPMSIQPHAPPRQWSIIEEHLDDEAENAWVV